MDRVPSVSDRVVLIVEEFFAEIPNKDAFETELTEFKLRLRAKLLEIVTSFPTDPEVANTAFNQAVEGMEEIVRKSIDSLDHDSEVHLLRAMKTLETLNEILKEFLYEDRVKDKKSLSSLSGYIGGVLEKLRKEYKRRFGGLLNTIKRWLGRG